VKVKKNKLIVINCKKLKKQKKTKQKNNNNIKTFL